MPSCLISCSHKGPEGGRGAVIGKHGANRLVETYAYWRTCRVGIGLMARSSIMRTPVRRDERKSPRGCPGPKGVAFREAPRKTIGQCRSLGAGRPVGGRAAVVAALPPLTKRATASLGPSRAFDTSPR